MNKALFLIPLLLSACSMQKEWSYNKVVSKNSQFSSQILYYHPENEVTGVGIELLKGAFGTYGYLSVCARKIPPLPEASNQSIVVFLIDEDQFPYKAERMLGGQKLLLPEEATEKLMKSLINNQIVTIYLDGYMSKIEPKNFPKLKKFS